MNLGSKLKNARTHAGYTQEEAADRLGVSRQTISNWENEKTYPDIGRVIAMSDLYGISLDHLLKEEQPVSKYLDYLEESTDVVRSKNRFSKLIILISYLVVWSFGLIVFWFFTEGFEALGYGITFLWFLLPITTFALSLWIGKNDLWGSGKWFVAIGFGAMYMLAEYATFSAANMAAFGKINPPYWGMLPVGALVSVAGMALGAGIRAWQKQRAAKRPTTPS